MRVDGGQRRLGALAQINAKLDALSEHVGIQFDPYGQMPERVTDALKRGDTIEAIKRYREATGVGLKEAKELVEELESRSGMGT